jgi:hypothetical protein
MPQSKKLCFIITREGLGWVTKTLCTQKEANAFSIWNNNLGYQGIVEYAIERPGCEPIDHPVLFPISPETILFPRPSVNDNDQDTYIQCQTHNIEGGLSIHTTDTDPFSSSCASGMSGPKEQNEFETKSPKQRLGRCSLVEALNKTTIHCHNDVPNITEQETIPWLPWTWEGRRTLW